MLDYANPKLPRMTRSESQEFYRSERPAERMAQGLPLKPEPCSVCGGRPEGADNCQLLKSCGSGVNGVVLSAQNFDNLTQTSG